MSFKIKGMKELERKLSQLSNSAKSLEGTNEVPLVELFSSAFMRKNTKFTSFEEFADNSSFDFTDLNSIPEKSLDQFVGETTKFSKWEEMLTKASEEWTLKQLGL